MVEQVDLEFGYPHIYSVVNRFLPTQIHSQLLWKKVFITPRFRRTVTPSISDSHNKSDLFYSLFRMLILGS